MINVICKGCKIPFQIDERKLLENPKFIYFPICNRCDNELTKGEKAIQEKMIMAINNLVDNVSLSNILS